MLIAVDKNNYDKCKTDNELVYLFENEPLADLLKTKLHCLNYKKCEFVDINSTDYDIDCFKKAKIEDKDYIEGEIRDTGR